MKKVKTPLMALIAIFIGIIMFIPIQSSAQDTAHKHKKSGKTRKLKERIDVIKKVKLLDALGLDEKKADAFLAKYNDFSSRLNENHKQYKEASINLRNFLNNNNEIKVSDDSLKKITNNIIDLQEQYYKISSEKMKSVAEILDVYQYAKFVSFENSFNREFMGLLNDKHKGHKDKAKRYKKFKHSKKSDS